MSTPQSEIKPLETTVTIETSHVPPAVAHPRAEAPTPRSALRKSSRSAELKVQFAATNEIFEFKNDVREIIEKCEYYAETVRLYAKNYQAMLMEKSSYALTAEEWEAAIDERKTADTAKAAKEEQARAARAQKFEDIVDFWASADMTRRTVLRGWPSYSELPSFLGDDAPLPDQKKSRRQVDRQLFPFANSDSDTDSEEAFGVEDYTSRHTTSNGR